MFLIQCPRESRAAPLHPPPEPRAPAHDHLLRGGPGRGHRQEQHQPHQ